ncbi:TonB-dependent receptor [uncultured Sphingorhabdus sp.]|uniref:TonB-dependent receptor n=1 Tax=uncultured Sphingorhabdus sp. TaxID=1686106 RepID=UPI00262D9955|nr:TonB-dependent receptor [uncultured Sphingorhabdus sp.]HMS20953.1 TonB-dependent receptor [Sphingorhabdus sp.]
MSKFARSSRFTALSTASSLALCALIAQPALAQSADEADASAVAAETEEEIIVTGFRKSLENAQNIKKDADTFVDVITAEDIGALADRSVAEALQRVPGVNISRFEQRNDPDRFSVEGSGVIIRGLPYVRSELNGRDIFSANGGRELSFNDVSPELLGRVEVFKNNTSDMIEGGISGSVNLVTRKPLDKPGLHIAGTIEGNYGDMAKEWSPGFSILGSNTFETGMGTFGLQLAYAQSELVTKTDASQITDPCYRAASLTAACIRVRPVGSGGFGGSQQFNESNFPPAGAIFVPKGAGVRTTDLTRDRNAFSAVGQWESNDGSALVTVEYLRAETDATLNEYAVLALVNDDGLFPVVAPGTTPVIENGQFISGTLTQLQPFTGGRGIPTELLRFQREDTAMTEDLSVHLKLNPSDRLRFNFEVQHIKSDRTEDGFISAMQTYSDVRIDNSGTTPQVEFLQPGSSTSPSSYFNDPSRTFYWFLLDNQVKNDGELTSMRFDGEYDVSDDGFFKKARFGARWGDRNRVTRSANFSNWGNLGAPWTGRGGNWNCGDFQAFGCGGAYVRDFPNSANLRNPFGSGFQRGNAPVPLGDGSAFFFGGDNMVADYLSGAIRTQAAAITAYTLTPNAWFPISARASNLPGGVWNAGEISDVDESTFGAYARVDYGANLSDKVTLSGNIGLRYVSTKVQSGGSFSLPSPEIFDNNGNRDGVVQLAEVQGSCAFILANNITPVPGYCGLTPERQAAFAALFTGEIIPDPLNIRYTNWLPSFNAKLDFGNGILVRGAVSKGISRPDLSSFASGGGAYDNTNNLRAGGTLATGPLIGIRTGNRFLRPVESWNYDLSVEWYWADVGSLTVSAFVKDIKNIVNSGAVIRPFQTQSGITDVLFDTPVNSDGGTLKGAEIAYQQTYDFLPGFLSGLGAQLTYTYVDAGDFNNSTLGSEQSPFAGGLPLAGVSKHTVNAVAFYEKGPISARVAYNWRSDFLQTPRDVIFPFSPIYGESTGQLDGSIFFTVMDGIKLGVQGVNLLDEVTRTSQVIDFNGTRATRSAFRNDRRFTFLARFEF